ncbi:MAG TPA: hypothetical protein VK589_22140 [Chryseolinea sp.]|nr:hypothetical protein [Chryseolinea sp.]
MRLYKLIALFILISPTTFGQTKSDVFKEDVTVTWLGLDFTSTKLIGDREKFGSESDVRHLLDAWNDLIINESDKFNVARAIDRKKVENAPDVAKEHNAELDVMAMFSEEPKDYLHVTPSDVEQIVADYDFKGKSGIGLMFIVESFSKLNEEGSIWATFINMDSKEVLFSERLTAPPKGFGMRNFWAGSVFGVLTKMEKKEFEMWRKKHFRP